MRATDGRRGRVLSIRVTDEERARIEAAMKKLNPHSTYYKPPLGPWILGAALRRAGEVLGPVVPARAGSTASSRTKLKGARR